MTTEVEILQYLHFNSPATRSDIETYINNKVSSATVKRIISQAVKSGSVISIGNGRSVKYRLSNQAHITMPLNLDTYFEKEANDRVIQTNFNFDLINDILPNVSLFTDDEYGQLEELHCFFRKNISHLTPNEYRKEMERLGIDLSWKSSQIEGNTYSLLETERLLKEKKQAKGKTQEEAIMLLNHKDALDYILDAPEYSKTLTIRNIEDIHTLLVKDLNVDRHIRNHRVGITGTNYRPLDNEYQIREAMECSCQLINSKKNIFDKALLTLMLLSYIQAFADGNKRTARITSNSILIANGYCPISFRTVDSLDYKKAMLIFYEQNNIHAFKKIFIDQYKYAVDTYF